MVMTEFFPNFLSTRGRMLRGCASNSVVYSAIIKALVSTEQMRITCKPKPCGLPPGQTRSSIGLIKSTGKRHKE